MFSVELYWMYVPLMFMKVYSVVRVCVVMLISGISNCKVDRLEDKNTGDSYWIWSASVIRSMTLPFLSN